MLGSSCGLAASEDSVFSRVCGLVLLCGLCLEALFLGAYGDFLWLSFVSPFYLGRSFRFQWVKCQCFEVVLSLDLQPTGSSELLGKGCGAYAHLCEVME